ncbi:MAG TPA: transcription termination factor Rho, partial [Firmicutes bacterium]|nr:transcription termination factor Rho [Bacillota bacterium]
MTLRDLEHKTLTELTEMAAEYEIPNVAKLRKRQVIEAIMQAQAQKDGMEYTKGVLEILPDGFGFLRRGDYAPSNEDIYVSVSQIRRFMLRTGDTVSGLVRPPKDSEKYHALLRVERVNDLDPEQSSGRKPFEDLTPIYPNRRLLLETDPKEIAMRLMDVISPIGKGQRGMVVSPPKAGKTTLLKNIANSLTTNHPELELIVLLIDERPEEVTDMQRSVHGEVISSTFDQPSENHVRVAEL